MNKKQKRNKYTRVKLSLFADLKIRARLFWVYLRRLFKGAGEGLSFKVMSGAMAVVLLVVFVAPSQFSSYTQNRFVDRAEAAQQDLESRKEIQIFHQKILVSEGKDKAAYVAKVKNIPLEDASSVELRHDTILEWEYGITNISHIETDVAGRPILVKLNLENEDHMHIFEYHPEDCRELKNDGLDSDGCSKEAIVTSDYLAHRSIFDEVHNIESTYEETVSYSPDKKSVNIRGLEYLERTDDYVVFRTLNNNVEERYYFDSETYLLKKRVTSILEEGIRYEMSEVELVEIAFIDKEKQSEIFDPAAYSFEQLEVIPL